MGMRTLECPALQNRTPCPRSHPTPLPRRAATTSATCAEAVRLSVERGASSSRPAVRSPGLSPPAARLGTWKALLGRRAGCAVAAPQPAACSPDRILAAAPASAECVQAEGELPTSAGHSTGRSHASPAGLARALCFVFWPVQGTAVWYSVGWGGRLLCQCGPSSSCRGAAGAFLQVPCRAGPALGRGGVGMFAGCVCNCRAPDGGPASPRK